MMKASKINQATVQQLHDYLHGKRYQYRTEEDELGIFSFERMLPCAIHTLDFRIFVKDDRYSVYGILPFHLDVKDPVRVQRMCELLTRANYTLPNGCFELDLSDGELRYRTYVSTEGGMIPNQEIIRDSILTVDAAMVYFGDSLVQVLFGPPDTSVEDLVKKTNHAVEMKLLEHALRSAAENHTPLEESLGWLPHWLQDDHPKDSADEEPPLLPEAQAAGE